MKERFDLQLFAEEAAADTESVATAENTIEDKSAATEQGKESAASTTSKETESEKKYSDKDLDDILNKKFAKWKEQEQKKVDEAKKLATMSATEKAEYERDQLKKERDELKKERDTLKAEATLIEMRKTTQKMLAEKGVKNVSDELLKMIVTTDAEKTKAAVDSFAILYQQDIEKAVNERLKGETPTVGAGRAAVHVSELQKRIKKYE